MIPLKDDNPTKSFPIITILIIAINIVIFFYMMSLSETANRNLVNLYGATPYEIMHGIGLKMGISLSIIVTIGTSMFLHGGLFHLLGNMLYLWIFGNNIEDSMGHIRFIFFYIICGAIAVLGHSLINHGSMIPMIGASGAISGILGGYLILFPRAKILTLFPIFIFFKTFRIPALYFLGIWIILQVIPGLSTLSAENTGGDVAWFAHIGGFLAGVILIGFFKKGNR